MLAIWAILYCILTDKKVSGVFMCSSIFYYRSTHAKQFLRIFEAWNVRQRRLQNQHRMDIAH